MRVIDWIFTLAITGLGNYAMPDYGFGVGLVICRLFVIACGAALGLFGVPELPLPYLRVLAIGPQGRQLLAQMKQRCSVPFSESLLKLSQQNARCAAFAEEERRATDFYNFVRTEPLAVGEDFTRRLYVSENDLSV